MHVGERGNVLANDIRFSGSARLLKAELADKFAEEFTLILDGITKAYRCSYTFNQSFRGIPVLNNPLIAKISQQAIRKYLGDEYLIDEYDSMMGSDSYSLLTKLYPGIMIHLGIDNPSLGSGSDLHTDTFDLDESVLPLGTAATAAFALEYLLNNEDPHHEKYPGTISELLGERL
jgi:amidohydrolase